MDELFVIEWKNDRPVPNERQIAHLIWEVDKRLVGLAHDYNEDPEVQTGAVVEFAASLPVGLGGRVITRWNDHITEILTARQRATDFMEGLTDKEIEPPNNWASLDRIRARLLQVAAGEPIEDYSWNRNTYQSPAVETCKAFGQEYNHLYEKPKAIDDEDPGQESIWTVFHHPIMFSNAATERKHAVKFALADFRAAGHQLHRMISERDRLFSNTFTHALEFDKYQTKYEGLREGLTKPLEDYVWTTERYNWSPFFGRKYAHQLAQNVYSAKMQAERERDGLINTQAKMKEPFKAEHLLKEFEDAYGVYTVIRNKALISDAEKVARKDKAAKEQDELAGTPVKIPAISYDDGGKVLIDLKALKKGLVKRKGYIVLGEALIYIPQLRKYLVTALKDPATGRTIKNYGPEQWASLETVGKMTLEYGSGETHQGIRLCLPILGSLKIRTQFISIGAQDMSTRAPWIHPSKLVVLDTQETPLAWTPQMINEKRPVLDTRAVAQAVAAAAMEAGG